MESIPPDEVRDALVEMQLYFSDRVAPLLVGDSLALLMSLPAAVLAQEIQSWVTGQFRASGPDVATSEYLFHALRKVHAIGEFQLVQSGQFSAYLEDLAAAVVELCPPADRDILKAHLARLGENATTLATPVATLHRFEAQAAPQLAARRPPETGGVSGANLTQEMATSIKRFSLLMERLNTLPISPGSAVSQPQNEIASQLVSSAAAISATQKDLDSHLEKLKQLGMAGGTDEMFRVLGQSLPGWAVPEGASGFVAPTANARAEAMEKIIALSREDPAESSKRFRQMVQVAIDQFNGGSLARALAILEIADRVAEQKLVHSSVVDRVRATAHEKLDGERLRKLAESPDKRPQLNKVMNFFLALSPEGLLNSLRSEQKRDQRRLDLVLLEAHGPPARAAALARLEASVRGPGEPEDPQFQRNLLYLLRLIPHPPGTPWDGEVEILRQLSRSSSPSFLVKEVITSLGQVLEAGGGEKPERVLVFLLRNFERMLQKREAIYATEDVLALLDRITSVMARQGGPTAWAEVVDHGLSSEGDLGNAAGRLDELGGRDLSPAPDVLGRLLDVLAVELPKKASLAGKKEAWVVSLIRALGGTNTQRVREVLKEVVAKYPNRPTAHEAARVLSAFDSAAQQTPARPTTSLSGDLELFGLSTLLQNMAELKATGTLTLIDVEGRPAATLLLEGGKLAVCQAGRLSGREAFYQLFEKPFPGTFGLVRKSAVEPSPEALDVLPMVLEAIHRYDELERASALVPDEAEFEPTGIAPTRPPDEADEALVSVLWDRATRGYSAARCDGDLPVDSYRVRHLLEHWVQEGALQRR
jgi:hypothetical protein